MYNKTVLDNGLRVITYPMPERRSVALGVWIGVGGRYEREENKGSAHFLEHLLFKGSKKYTCQKIKQSIEGIGGSLNGFTSEELTCYLAKVPEKYYPLSLDILLDMVINPTLPDLEVEKERKVIIEEIRMYRDLPGHQVQELLDGMLWPNHPLGMNLSGSPESINNITREGLFGFKKSHYLSPNMVVAVCGNIQGSSLLRQIESKCSSLEGGRRIKFLPAGRNQRASEVKSIFKQTEQTHLALGFYGIPRDDPDKYRLSLLNTILGANMSSRLFQQVRERRGLAYEIGSFTKSFLDSGAFIVHAGVDTHKAPTSVKVILEVIDGLRSKPVKKGELERAKEFFTGQLAMALEDTLEHMLWIGGSMTVLNKTYTYEEVASHIHRITPGELLRLAKKIFSSPVYLSLVGPLDERKLKTIIDGVNLWQ